MKRFALIGAAGYVAPRHLQAIAETGNELVAALDPSDSVGILDRYFPEAAFFTEFERFDRHLEKLKRNGTPIDYLTICSPNYLHDAHIRFGLRHGADVICEKPIVLNPWNLTPLKEIENDTGQSIFCVLQLRLHPSVIALKKMVESAPSDKLWDIELTYITTRGNWYYASWKGDNQKSGGIATNIGIHFFDMLIWIFGKVLNQEVHVHSHDRAAGVLRLENGNVRWFLSINGDTLPSAIRNEGRLVYRSLKIDDEEFDFSQGFENLHTKSYQEIFSGQGFRIDTTKQGIDLVYQIRNSSLDSIKNDFHSFVKLPEGKHPFHRMNN